MLVLPGTLNDQEVEAKVGEVVTLVKEFGEVSESKPLGKTRLAYPIKQVRYGYFYQVIFSAETENIKLLQEKLGLMRDLLRAIVNVHDEKTAAAKKVSYFGDYDKTAPVHETVRRAALAEAPVSEAPAEEKEEKEEKEEAPKEISRPVSTTPLDLKEIDKKLDAILADDNINI